MERGCSIKRTSRRKRLQGEVTSRSNVSYLRGSWGFPLCSDEMAQTELALILVPWNGQQNFPGVNLHLENETPKKATQVQVAAVVCRVILSPPFSPRISTHHLCSHHLQGHPLGKVDQNVFPFHTFAFPSQTAVLSVTHEKNRLKNQK